MLALLTRQRDMLKTERFFNTVFPHSLPSSCAVDLGHIRLDGPKCLAYCSSRISRSGALLPQAPLPHVGIQHRYSKAKS